MLAIILYICRIISRGITNLIKKHLSHCISIYSPNAFVCGFAILNYDK